MKVNKYCRACLDGSPQKEELKLEAMRIWVEGVDAAREELG